MLYIVATPIGNLKDITLRALEALKEVDFILCEDTRVTRNLLNHYEIKDKKLVSYHHHTDARKMEELVELIKNNKVALVTDAGTPGISDPGGLLIKALKQEYTRPQHLV
ncbi:MAG TPA: SAM-dependent methyltransferase, partial [bacterium]|nr:SAM-dependent methyltransferase [bacterium]